MNEQMAIGDMPDEQARLVFLRVFYKALGEVARQWLAGRRQGHTR